MNRLRSHVGMVFQKPVPFPMSIYDNISYAIKHHEKLSRREMEDRVEQALRGAALWDEVKDKLKQSATGLSGGQQQRLCIARTIALRPQVLLLDEPTSALDPISTGRIEQLITELKEQFTVIIVTHNMQQAARCSDYTAFMFMGELIEHGDTDTIFTKPSKTQTETTSPVVSADQPVNSSILLRNQRSAGSLSITLSHVIDRSSPGVGKGNGSSYSKPNALMAFAA